MPAACHRGRSAECRAGACQNAVQVIRHRYLMKVWGASFVSFLHRRPIDYCYSGVKFWDCSDEWSRPLVEYLTMPELVSNR